MQESSLNAFGDSPSKMGFFPQSEQEQSDTESREEGSLEFASAVDIKQNINFSSTIDRPPRQNPSTANRRFQVNYDDGSVYTGDFDVVSKMRSGEGNL